MSKKPKLCSDIKKKTITKSHWYWEKTLSYWEEYYLYKRFKTLKLNPLSKININQAIMRLNLEARFRFYRLLIKGKFYVYLLWIFKENC